MNELVEVTYEGCKYTLICDFDLNDDAVNEDDDFIIDVTLISDANGYRILNESDLGKSIVWSSSKEMLAAANAWFMKSRQIN